MTYYHQMLSAVLVHPDQAEVFQLAPEPIMQQDGHSKNDCVRAAAVRLLNALRREHPHMKLIVIEDGLASNAPHIRLLQKLNLHFIHSLCLFDDAGVFGRSGTAALLCLTSTGKTKCKT